MRACVHATIHYFYLIIITISRFMFDFKNLKDKILIFLIWKHDISKIFGMIF